MAISPADKEQIVALAKDGCSRSVIADRIGHGVTRSAVCGLLFRLGTQTARFPRICKRRRAFPKLLASEARKLPVEITRITRIGVPLFELDDDGCHWPVTGEGRDMLFCNASRIGSSHPSYCRHHHARSIRIEYAERAPAIGPKPCAPFMRKRQPAQTATAPSA